MRKNARQERAAPKMVVPLWPSLSTRKAATGPKPKVINVITDKIIVVVALPVSKKVVKLGRNTPNEYRIPS